MQTKLFTALLLGALTLSAASGQHIKRATLSTKSGTTVSSQEADSSGRIMFTGVRPGEYMLTLTNAEGRSVSVGDLDGDGALDIAIGDPGVNGAAGVKSPRDSASGQATGKRQHKPMNFVVDWSGSVKGGFMSEQEAQSAGQRMPASPAGACSVKVVLESQPGCIEIKSSSWDLKASKK